MQRAFLQVSFVMYAAEIETLKYRYIKQSACPPLYFPAPIDLKSVLESFWDEYENLNGECQKCLYLTVKLLKQKKVLQKMHTN